MPDPEQPSRLDEFEAELTAMKRREAIQAKHGGNLTDEQIAFYQAEEDKAAKKAEMRAQAKEAGVIARVEQEKKRLQFCIDLFNSGHLVITLGGQRLTRINKDATLPCTHCGASMINAQIYVVTMGMVWSSHPSPHNLITAKGQPFGFVTVRGFPILAENISCPACRQRNDVVIQLVL